ncbi:MAG TPA: ATP-dependent 6-phosphofructokinase, partial [Spirochaetota bacterium]|nr:ATP-dependent 6-phosphofructokinase [Spirochaetota bacterium]
MENIELDLTIDNIGECRIDSPLLTKSPSTDFAFVADDKKVLYNVVHSANGPVGRENPTSFEKAGPRRKIFFDPGRARVAIITCGGLCPGTNDVIRSLVMESHYRYGVQSIIGIRYGFLGLNPGTDNQPVSLTPEYVRDIHKMGGTILGSSRGGTDDMESIVDSLERQYINILYVIGGDGSLRAAHDIAVIARRRRLKLSVIGIPKTIDNDVSYIQRTFGFETAFSRAVDSIYAAHIEAEGTPNGIGLVKLMGRHSGFIAASSALAMNDVNFVLIPEVPFELDGPNGF